MPILTGEEKAALVNLPLTKIGSFNSDDDSEDHRSMLGCRCGV